MFASHFRMMYWGNSARHKPRIGDLVGLGGFWGQQPENFCPVVNWQLVWFRFARVGEESTVGAAASQIPGWSHRRHTTQRPTAAAGPLRRRCFPALPRHPAILSLPHLTQHSVRSSRYRPLEAKVQDGPGIMPDTTRRMGRRGPAFQRHPNWFSLSLI